MRSVPLRAHLSVSSLDYVVPRWLLIAVIAFSLAGTGCCAQRLCGPRHCQKKAVPTEDHASAMRPPRSRFHPVPTRPVFAPHGVPLEPELPPAKPAAIAPRVLPLPEEKPAPAPIPPEEIKEPAPILEKQAPVVPPPPAASSDAGSKKFEVSDQKESPASPAEESAQPGPVEDPFPDMTGEAPPPSAPVDDPFPDMTSEEPPPPAPGQKESSRAAPRLNAPIVTGPANSRRGTPTLAQPARRGWGAPSSLR